MKPLYCATVVAFAFAAAGCVSLPEPQFTPTGEPLSVRTESGSYQVTEKKKVGQIDHRDSHGRRTGSSTIYANRKRTVHYTTWNSFQGEQQISDDDLYRIAKDTKAEQEVREMREAGVLLNRIGLGVLLVGVAAAVTGGVLYARAGENDDKTVPTLLLGGGGLSLGISGYLLGAGYAKAHKEHPLEQERAEQAADAYNATLPGRARRDDE